MSADTIQATAEEIASASNWETRIALIRKVPETFGTAQHQEVYASIAQRVYVPDLAPDFAYIHWREEYGLAAVASAYELAYNLTDGFTLIDPESLTRVIRDEPITLRVFRLLLGFTAQEFAAATGILAARLDLPAVGPSRVKGMESGSPGNEKIARACAAVVHEAMTGALFPAAHGPLRSKIDKPDTQNGWESVREYAQQGVPLHVFLHQRHYGGAFRQLLDATSTQRGDVIEDAVEALLEENGVPFLRTGSHNQAEIEDRFGITVKPAPDFVVFAVGSSSLRALLECKGANDGGTARDKAARFHSLRTEATRLGGIPLFAVLAGLGWKRTADALGPVVRDTDGRVFTVPTLETMLQVQPFPALSGSAPAVSDQA